MTREEARLQEGWDSVDTDTNQGLSSASPCQTLCKRLGYSASFSPSAASEAGTAETAPEAWVLGTVQGGPNLWGAQGLMGTLEVCAERQGVPQKEAVAFELGLGRVFRDLQPGTDLQSLLIFHDDLARCSRFRI